MSVSDPIADFLTRIRNAVMAGNQNVSIPSSKIKVALAKILVEEGFIDGFEQVSIEDKPQDALRINLKYVGERRDRKPVITGLKRVSKPGRRIYVGRGEIPWVQSGLGIAILTTPKGVVTGVRARQLGVGGEVLCEVW
ncbi:MAG: 30S ribosomal protein S8 [Anaerolineales bacterium]|jgi:small subunit ribosomal protein S8|nr:30S ribosomal protein S8 [Anaerolineales bacterium]TET36441.1 MAG: 30S ribosomal protein S8 [Anaerolineales bacterium]